MNRPPPGITLTYTPFTHTTLFHPARVNAAIRASGVRARPLRQASDWGYQRMTGGQTRVIVDVAPPPVQRLAHGGAASTLAFELSDDKHRLVVNCGGRSEEHTSELQSLMRISYAVFCLKKKKT